MSPESITAVAATAAALIAVIAIIVQWRQSLFAARLNTLLTLWNHFDTDRLREARRSGAIGLLAGEPAEAEDVLDFFEGVGLLLRKGAIDAEMAWSSFAAWEFAYFQAAREYIRRAREDDDTTWADLEYLHDKLIDVQITHSRMRRTQVPFYSDEQLADFLNTEARLRIRSSNSDHSH